MATYSGGLCHCHAMHGLAWQSFERGKGKGGRGLQPAVVWAKHTPANTPNRLTNNQSISTYSTPLPTSDAPSDGATSILASPPLDQPNSVYWCCYYLLSRWHFLSHVCALSAQWQHCTLCTVTMTSQPLPCLLSSHNWVGPATIQSSLWNDQFVQPDQQCSV